MKGSEFVFSYIHVLYYKCHKINLNCGGSNIDSPDWIKKTINPSNKNDNKCFQYAVTIVLNHEEIKNNREGINYLSEKDDWKRIEKKKYNYCPSCFVC